MTDDSDPLPTGSLITRMHDPEVHAEIKAAGVILGVHHETGKHAGVFFGAAPLGRIVRRNVSEYVAVLRVPIDPDTDDIEVLAALVKVIKGVCCYPKGDGGTS